MLEINWKDVFESYLRLGWSVIPIGNNKKPLILWKNYQSHRATTAEVDQWVQDVRLKGIAVVTGKLSNVVVLDIDAGSNFDTSKLPFTPRATTGKGLHVYLKYPSGAELSNLTAFQPHTDLRAEGGYAVLPPSLHPNGRRYSWEIEPHESEMAQIPDPLLQELIKAKGKPPIDHVSLDNIFAGVAQSTRNDSATKIIGKLLRQFPQSDWDTEVWELVRSWNFRNTPPLGEAELLTTYNSIKQIEMQSSADGSGRDGQAKQLIDLVLNSKSALYTDQYKEPCISFPDCTFVAYKLSSSQVKDYLYKLYWDAYGKPPSSEAVRAAIATLRGIISYEHPSHHLHNRIGRYKDMLFYDLGDNCHVVEINSSGWQIKTTCPLYFSRYGHQEKQLFPKAGGNLKELLNYVNTNNSNHQLLILTHLCVSFFPDVHRAILILHGDQGSAKSTLLRVLRSLIDPSQVALLSSPDTDREFVQIASHHYCLYLDNISSISQWLSDCLCRAVTGEGYSKRQLYSDDSDVLYAYMRAIGMSGIVQVANKPDLLDRSILIALERITDNRRRDDSTFWREFNQAKPKLLGAVFDVLVKCLGHITTLISSPHRLKDYYRFSVAAAQALGFTEQQLAVAFNDNSVQQNEEALEVSPVAQTIIKLMENRDHWDDSSAALYRELDTIATSLNLERGFPKSSTWLWRKIVEIRPNLISSGITPTKYRQANANYIKLEKCPTNVTTGSSDNNSGSGSSDNNGGNY